MKLETIISQLTMQKAFHSKRGKIKVVGSIKLPDENRQVRLRAVIVRYDAHADEIVIDMVPAK